MGRGGNAAVAFPLEMSGRDGDGLSESDGSRTDRGFALATFADVPLECTYSPVEFTYPQQDVGVVYVAA